MSVAGINAKISGSMQSASPKDLWKFDGGGDVGNFEVLVDTFYKSFSDSVFPFSFAGKYTPAARKFQSTTGALDLGEMGKFKASGDAQLGDARRQTYAQLNMRMNAEKVNVGNLFEEIGQQALSEVSPAFRDSVLGGMVSTDFRLGLRDKRWTAAGTFAMADGRVALDGSKLVVESLTVRLPFALYFPQNENQRDAVKFADPDFGKIQLQGIKFGPAEIPSLAVDVALKENALRARGPIPIALFDGKVTVSDIQGENLLGRSAALTTSALVEGMDVGQITTKLGLPEVLGRLDARFPAVRLGADALEAEGAAEIRIFGGAVSGTRLGIEEPFSPVRTFRGDLTFKDIDLSQVTETLKFGRITGVMEGSVKGLEISQGQAAAFVADFETVPRKRVPQTINFDAVQNITILGTGQGFQATLGRGFASFFDEFKYRKIGFYCSLKNDNFRMKGKVVQGETEYFVKGIMLGPSINVINRNPGQTVSFKSMLERISRVKREKGSEESGE
ncbi:MAG: hypothetical protein HY801_00210 [Candidatus Lindowbacteria bacterium]|nr:hypothetical protein [Candidatus Lindowbacteria bacterium]